METQWEPEIQSVLARNTENGAALWAREDGDIHAPAGFSTIDVLTALGDMGATIDRFPLLKEAVTFIKGYQNDDGSFRYGVRKSRLPCITARVLAAFGRIGVPLDGDLRGSYAFLLGSQWHDGGWRCSTVKLGKSTETDLSNPGTTLFVLDAFRFWKKDKNTDDELQKAVGFLLDHWETRLPLGPCEFGIGSRFMKVEYPFRRYTLFYYVFVLAHYKCAIGDKRFRAAVDELFLRLRDDGLLLETVHKSWRDMAQMRQNQPSVLAGNHVKRIKALLGSG